MKNKLIDYLMIGFIVLVLIIGFLLENGCSDTTPDIIEKEPIEISWCIPNNYEIIYDGKSYTWRIIGFIYWDMFKTLDEAIESACRHNYIQTMERYEMEWEVIPVCHFQAINT